MGKIIESTLMTLDGVIEDPATWAGDYFDEEFQKGALERLMRTDAMMMGRRTYELLFRDWSAQTDDFADRINSIRKYVFSATVREPAWNNTIVVQGDVVREGSTIKEQTQGELAVYGHGLFSATLLKNGLIDELRLSVFPVVAGKGQLFFREGARQTLRLVEATPLRTGVLVMRYQPVKSG